MPSSIESDLRDDVRAGIVGAAARLLTDQGLAGLTTRGVAQAAGVQAPTIYRLFGDKDGLIDAVAEYVMATYVSSKAETAATAATTDDDPVLDLRAGWRTHLEFGLANPELYVLLNSPGRRAASPATIAGIEVLRIRVHRLAVAGLLRVDEQRALMMIHAAGTGTVLALLGAPLDERDPGLSDAMLEAVLGRILIDAPAVPDRTTTTAAVSFGAVLPDLPALTTAERALMTEWLDRSLRSLRR